MPITIAHLTQSIPYFNRYSGRVNIRGQDSSGLKFALIMALIGYAASAPGADRYSEKRLAAQLGKHIKVGKPVQIPIKNDSFFAIYTESRTPKSRGGVILLHGLGAHPDWPEMISPLRQQLPDYGWNSLSIHLSVVPDYASHRDYERLFRDTHKRIRAAIEFLENKGIYNIVLIGHSLGASMGLTYITSESGKSSGIIAFVGIAMYDLPNLDKQFLTPVSISAINKPVLDIIGSLDTMEIKHAARSRHSAAKKSGSERLSQLTITGADHFFTGLENKLLKRIRLWINKQAPSLVIDLSKEKSR